MEHTTLYSELKEHMYSTWSTQIWGMPTASCANTVLFPAPLSILFKNIIRFVISALLEKQGWFWKSITVELQGTQHSNKNKLFLPETIM